MKMQGYLSGIYHMDGIAFGKGFDIIADSVQQAVRQGKGFATIEELEKWLEGADSWRMRQESIIHYSLFILH